MNRSRLICFLIVGIIAALAFTGCQAQKKPAPLGPGGTPSAPMPPAPTTQKQVSQPTNMGKTTESLAREAAKVKGVNKASVVLTNNTALVGLDLKAGANVNTVKSQVVDAIKKSNKMIKNVLVSTDPELNSRLLNISRGITQGKPVGTFTKEINELRNRMSPATK